MEPETPTDETLVRATRRGDEAAFDELYRRYGHRLFSYVLRLLGDRELAEDLLQEVFMAVLRDRSFDLRPGGFGAWIFTVARRRCLNQLRADARHDDKLDAFREAGDAASARSPEAAVEARQLVLAGLASLSLAQRDALVLKEVGGLTYREIAVIQEVPEGTAKSRLHFAIRTIRSLLRGDLQES